MIYSSIAFVHYASLLHSTPQCVRLDDQDASGSIDMSLERHPIRPQTLFLDLDSRLVWLSPGRVDLSVTVLTT